MDQLMQFFFKYTWPTFAKGQFSFAYRPAWWLVALSILGLGGLIYFLYFRPGYRLKNSTRWELVVLRTLLLAMLLLMVMRPVVVIPSVIPKSTSVAILADDSRSMQLTDENNRPRIDAARELLAPDQPFTRQLDEKFKVRLYGFSTTVEKVKDGGALKAEGAATDLVGALEEAVKDSAGANLSALIVVSDGGANTPRDLGEELRQMRARNLPVFTIGVGNPNRFKDVEVARVNVPRRVLIGSAISADVYLRLNGYDDVSKLTLAVSEDGRALKTQAIDLRANPAGAEAHPVTIEYTPSSPGAHRYTFEVAPLDGETTAENNAQDALIEVTNDRPKILYLEGEPRWEYGKIRFSLARNEKNLALVSVLRSADGKFYRQGVESGSELANGFPQTIEELFTYQGLMLGSIEANFFSYDQLRGIEQFAAKRGGGVLALGGGKSFDAGKYANTPVADLLPVLLNDQVEGPELTVASNFKATLTARGRTHPVTRLNEDRAVSAKAWEEMPPITMPEILLQTKPGATTILEASHVTEKSRLVPLLVEQRYGRGRTLAFLTNDTWRWRMELPSQNTSHETFWRQLLRYQVSTTPNQYEVASERDVYAIGDRVTLRGEVNDKKFDSITDAQVTTTITKPSGEKIEIPLSINYSEKISDYRGMIAVQETGLYQVEMAARRAGAILGEAKSSFLVSERTREFFEAAQNVDLMKRIAAETGGKYYPLSEARKLLDEITMLEGKNSERVSKDLWDMPINFLLLIGLASAEWFLRKRQGLA